MSGLRRFLLAALVTLACFAPQVIGMSSAAACPMCKIANESDDRRPRAYMYSILFMLAMPATVFTGFGISFYRMARKAQLVADQQTPEQPTVEN
ncbi:MAG: hypothetical protein JNL58_06815 [Planctomyces sp.]|nr:hypothetical protein [Planctomyces sp.]